MKNKTLSAEDISDIRVLLAQGRSVVNLAIQYGCHWSTIYRRINTYRDHRRLGRKKTKRRRKCTMDQLWALVNFFRNDPFAGALECKQFLRLPVTTRTINRYCKMLKIYIGVAPKKFYIAPDHCENRIRYAIAHHLWGVEKWESIVFTDESGMCNGGNWRRHVRRLGRGEHESPKYANRFVNKTCRANFFSYVSIHGVGELTFHKRINNLVYCHDIVLPMVEDLKSKFEGRDFKIIHDNASFSQCDRTWRFLRTRKLDQFFKRIPPYSPDSNIIENLWALLKKRVKDKIFEHGRLTKRRFEELIQSEWRDIPFSIIRKLYDSLPRRMRAIVEADGQLSRY